MEDNKFEKEVRHLLGDIKLEPSEKAWSGIESHISKRHRPIQAILLIILISLIFLAGGYQIWNWSFHDGQSLTAIEKESKNISEPGQEEMMEKNVFIPVEEDNVSTLVLGTTGRPTKKESSKEAIQSHLSARPQGSYKHNSQKQGNGQSSPYRKSLPGETDVVNGSRVHRIPVSEIPRSGKASEEKFGFLKDVKVGFLPTQKIKEIVVVNKTWKNIGKKETMAPIDIITFPNSKKWDYSMATTGGRTLLFDSFLDLGSNQNQPPLMSPNPHPEPGPGTPPGTGIGAPPKQPTTSWAFSVNIFFKKHLSPRSRISFGPGYRQFGIQQGVGQRVQAPEGNYYLNNYDALHKHKGKFHFLELPVSLETRLNQGTSLPLYWHGGIYISRLVASSALQFDDDQYIYLRDNSSFPKWQTGLSTGIDFLLFSREKVPVKIGPYFYYSPSKVSKEGLYGGKHLSSAGMKIEILLNPK